MTFPAAVKRTGPMTASKTGSGIKTPGSPGSPNSPGSPKLISTVSSVKAPLASKAPEKTIVGMSVKKVLPKSPASKAVVKPVVDAKSQPEKPAISSVTKGVTKSVTKPPPLKLNIKATDANGLQSPETPKAGTTTPTVKSLTKSPTTPTVKSLTKSPTTPTVKSLIKTPTTPTKTKSTLSTKSLTVSTGGGVKVPSSPITKSSQVINGEIKVPSSPITKSAQASTVSSLANKSPKITAGTKSSTTSSLVVKSSTSKSSISPSSVSKTPQTTTSSEPVISSTVAKCSSTSTVTKKLTMTSTAPKSSQLLDKPLTSTAMSVASETIVKENIKLKSGSSKAPVVKLVNPVKKTAAKSITEVKVPTTPIKKSTTMSRSTTASSISSVSLKTPSSPKSLTKEPISMKVLKPTNSVVSKTSVNSKLGPTSPKVMIKKETSNISQLSVKSSSSIVSKTSTLKSKVTPLTVSKNLVPKSPVSKTQPLTLTKISAKTPSSPTVKSPPSPTVKSLSSATVKKSPSSPTVKSPSSPTVKSPSSSTVKSPLSPTVKQPRTPSSTIKPPLSPIVKKLAPTKLILSPVPSSKSNSLSSSRLNSVSTESLASRLSPKSPMSPRLTKAIPKSPVKMMKKTEESKSKGIRGGQPVKKTIDISGTTELPSNLIFNNQEVLESTLESAFIEEIKPQISEVPDQVLDSSNEELKILKTDVNTNDDLETTYEFVNEVIPSDSMNVQNVDQSLIVQEHNLETIKEDLVEPSSITLFEEQKQDKENSWDFEVVEKEECTPQYTNNCSISLDDNHFNETIENINAKQFDETQSCVIDVEDHFEPMNDKLVLGDVPFETDSCQSDISDNEQPAPNEKNRTEDCNVARNHSVDNIFSFTEDLPDYDRADSTENFINQFMPTSMRRSEGASSISTDDGSILSRKSYSEAVVGSPKDGEYYFSYDFEIVDDCLDYDDEERSVFVEVTDKEFPELKPKDISGKRRNKKQKKRNCSNKTETQSDSNTSDEINYDPDDFNGSEFCHYVKMMKDCSFYPNGLFSSDSVKLSTSSSLSWLDISVRTTDDDLTPSTECLNTFEVFQASNLNKDFLTSIIGSAQTPTNETTSWFWKSIESRHQTNNRANITLCLKPRPKHLTTPRFMTLLALISEAKGYQIKPLLSENFVTNDCIPRFDDKIGRLMVQGFWLIGRLIKESLSEDEEVNCGNPFEFVDGDIGLWWAGVNMLDWQEFIKECGKNDALPNCYQFVVENMTENRHNFSEAVASMNAEPDDFMSELDMENFIHTVRNVKYYSSNCFVDSAENIEAMIESSSDNGSAAEWDNNYNEE